MKERPTKGQRFRLKIERSVEGIIVYGAPCSGHFEGKLPAGEVLHLDYQPEAWTKGCWLIPERYDYYERVFIPQEVRNQEDYSNYAIGISYKELMRDFELLPGS